MGSSLLIIVVGLVLLIVLQMVLLASRYKRVPRNKLLVIFGKTLTGKPEVHTSGAQFVWPVIQDYEYIDLEPVEKEIEMESKSKDESLIPLKAKMTFGISNDENAKNLIAEKLLATNFKEIETFGTDIIKTTIRKSLEEINLEETSVAQNKVTETIILKVKENLNKVGLQLFDSQFKFL